jgi:hypothetical protein
LALRSGGLTRGVRSRTPRRQSSIVCTLIRRLSDWQRLFFRRSDFLSFRRSKRSPLETHHGSQCDVGASVAKIWGVHIGSARVLSEENAGTADCIPSAYKEVIFESKRSSLAITKGPRLSLRLLGARARRRFGMTRWRARSLGLRPQVHFCGTVHKGHSQSYAAAQTASRCSEIGYTRRSSPNRRDNPTDGFGSIDPFATPSIEWPLFGCAVRRRRFPVGASPTRRTLQPALSRRCGVRT